MNFMQWPKLGSNTGHLYILGQNPVDITLKNWQGDDIGRQFAVQKILEVIYKKSTVLNLSGQRLSTLPDVFDAPEFQKLEVLDLSDNEFEKLPVCISTLVSLESLNLKSNKLTVLPSEIRNLTNLIELDFAENNVAVFPSKIGELVKLTALYAENNLFKYLPTNLKNLTNLKTFYLMNNQFLSDVPREILELPKRCEVNLTGCPLSYKSINMISNSDRKGPKIAI